MKIKEIYKMLSQMFIVIAGVGTVASGVVMCFQNRESSLVLATYGTGLMCFVFAFLSQFQSFSGVGIQAELKGEKENE